jgi:hypothetical protein
MSQTIWSMCYLPLCCYDKISGINNLKEEKFIWLMVSEGSVHGHLAPCALGEHYGGKSMW